MLLGGLISLSLSMFQHLAAWIYQIVFRHHLNHHSRHFTSFVALNAMLCGFAMVASLLGKGFARLPLLIASFILMFFWAISQAV